MAQRGGPWRLAGYAIPDGRWRPAELARRERSRRPTADRGLRWIVSVYVLGRGRRQASWRSSGCRRDGGEAGTGRHRTVGRTWWCAADGTPAHRADRDDTRRTWSSTWTIGWTRGAAITGWSDEAGLAAWIADAGDPHPSFRVARGMPVSASCDGRTRPGRGDAASIRASRAWR